MAIDSPVVPATALVSEVLFYIMDNTTVYFLIWFDSIVSNSGGVNLFHSK